MKKPQVSDKKPRLLVSYFENQISLTVPNDAEPTISI